jgi:hypothetical protein
LKDTGYDCFASASTALKILAASIFLVHVALVHVARFAADERIAAGSRAGDLAIATNKRGFEKE